MVHRLLCAGAVGLLAACNGAFPGSSATPVEALAVSGGAVTVAGPPDYCVNAATSRGQDGFALLAPCATLGKGGAIPFRNAVIAVQVGDAGSAAVRGSESAMAGLLETAAGAQLLSRTGDPARITVRETGFSNGTVFVIYDDANPVPIEGTQTREWRGFFDLGDRLVTISLRGLKSAPLSSESGTTLLKQAVEAVRAANLGGVPA